MGGGGGVAGGVEVGGGLCGGARLIEQKEQRRGECITLRNSKCPNSM